MKQIQYQDEIIEYEIIRSNIKNLYIKIKEGKVTIKAPLRLEENVIQEFIEKKKKWIYQTVKRTEMEKKEEQRNYTEEDYENLQLIIEPILKFYTRAAEVISKSSTYKRD